MCNITRVIRKLRSLISMVGNTRLTRRISLNSGARIMRCHIHSCSRNTYKRNVRKCVLFIACGVRMTVRLSIVICGRRSIGRCIRVCARTAIIRMVKRIA